MKNKLFAIALLFLIISCTHHSTKDEPVSKMEMTSIDLSPPVMETVKFAPPQIKDDADAEDLIAPVSTKPINKKKIIKDGNLSIKTNNVVAGKKSIDALLKQLNAYYESEGLENQPQSVSYNLKIRIPSANFEKALALLENGKDEITGKNIYARDVTEEYIDIESRLNNKKEYLKKYKQLLNKAASIKDIMAIEEIVRGLQEEIESKEGRLKYLNDQLTYSTLDIYLFQEKELLPEVQKENKFSDRVKNSLKDGWGQIISFTLWLIKNWPLLIASLLLIVVILRFLRKRARAKK